MGYWQSDKKVIISKNSDPLPDAQKQGIYGAGTTSTQPCGPAKKGVGRMPRPAEGRKRDLFLGMSYILFAAKLRFINCCAFEVQYFGTPNLYVDLVWI